MTPRTSKPSSVWVWRGPTATSSTARSTPRVTSLLWDTRDDYRTTVTVLTGAVGLILLIACVNVAGILLASLTLDILAANLPVTMPSGSPATLNLRVLGATLALTACQADGFRRRASSVDPIESLRND